MFEERRKDRRRSYSFTQHFQRALKTKGLRRIVAPMIATAVVAGASFAYCSSDSITGPSSSPSATAPSGPAGKPQATVISEEFPVLITDFPVTVSPTSCTGDVIDTRESKFNGSGKLTITPTGGLHIKLHINYSFKGVGTTHTNPVRQYVGSQEYDHETNATGNAVIVNEYQVKVIARAEHDVTALFPGDDFILHVNTTFNANQAAGLPPTLTPTAANAFVKCQ